MSNTTIPTTKERPLKFKSRIGETSVTKRLIFKNEDGSPHAITSYDFELPLKQQPGANTNIFRLIIGDGLEIEGDDENELTFQITPAQANRKPNVYFGLLRSLLQDQTWFNIDWEFFNGKYDGVGECDETNITLCLNGEIIEVIVMSCGSGSIEGAWINCGTFDASGGALPLIGGSGSDGAFKAFDNLSVTTEGTIDDVFLPVGTMIMARQDDPTNDWDTVTGWKYF